MTSQEYLDGRKQYQRPQAIAFCDQQPTLTSEGFYVPSDPYEIGYAGQTGSFLILSDDNRSQISLGKQRIENRKRMINGNMRSYHIADKKTISTSWDMLPSRSFLEYPDFDANGATALPKSQQFTSDGGAGGLLLLDWHENHPGSFWVLLAYDKYEQSAGTSSLGKYTEAVEVFFADFSYDIVRRGSVNHDFWNISIALEEV